MRFLLLISLFFHSLLVGANQRIEDSLVKDLDCEKLTANNVMQSLQPEAFSLGKTWPVTNWQAGPLGQCWALALTQRQAFYLFRFSHPKGESHLSKSDFRKLRALLGSGKNDHLLGSRESGFRVSNLDSNPSGLFQEIVRGDGEEKFQTLLEKRQRNRFYSLGNLDLIAGDRERDKKANRNTIKEIQESLKRGELPLLILRAAKMSQHAVLVKAARVLSDSSIELSCYDSNQPSKEGIIIFRNSEFYAPSIIGLFHNNAESPIGVFLRDENDMNSIRGSITKYYKNQCRHQP